MSQSRNNHKPRVARTADLSTIGARVLRSTVIDSKAPSSPLWMDHPDIQAAGQVLIQAGIDLAAGEKAAVLAALKARAARQEAGTLRVTWDDRFTVYAGHVEAVAQKPEDVTNLGCLLLGEASYAIAPPLGISVRYVHPEIRVWVHMPPGNFGCRIEVSPDPIAPGSFVARKGKGVRRGLGGYAPGTWWIRAASVGEQEISAYTTPVMVIVK